MIAELRCELCGAVRSAGHTECLGCEVERLRRELAEARAEGDSEGFRDRVLAAIGGVMPGVDPIDATILDRIAALRDEVETLKHEAVFTHLDTFCPEHGPDDTLGCPVCEVETLRGLLERWGMAFHQTVFHENDPVRWLVEETRAALAKGGGEGSE